MSVSLSEFRSFRRGASWADMCDEEQQSEAAVAVSSDELASESSVSPAPVSSPTLGASSPVAVPAHTQAAPAEAEDLCKLPSPVADMPQLPSPVAEMPQLPSPIVEMPQLPSPVAEMPQSAPPTQRVSAWTQRLPFLSKVASAGQPQLQSQLAPPVPSPAAAHPEPAPPSAAAPSGDAPPKPSRSQALPNSGGALFRPRVPLTTTGATNLNMLPAVCPWLAVSSSSSSSSASNGKDVAERHQPESVDDLSMDSSRHGLPLLFKTSASVDAPQQRAALTVSVPAPCNAIDECAMATDRADEAVVSKKRPLSPHQPQPQPQPQPSEETARASVRHAGCASASASAWCGDANALIQRISGAPPTAPHTAMDESATAGLCPVPAPTPSPPAAPSDSDAGAHSHSPQCTASAAKKQKVALADPAEPAWKAPLAFAAAGEATSTSTSWASVVAPPRALNLAGVGSAGPASCALAVPDADMPALPPPLQLPAASSVVSVPSVASTATVASTASAPALAVTPKKLTKERITQRLKQIQLGKNTRGYKSYLAIMPMYV